MTRRKKDQDFQRKSILKNFNRKIKQWQGKLCPLELMNLGLLDFVEPFDILKIKPAKIRVKDYFDILRYAYTENRELLYLWHMELSGHSRSLLELCGREDLQAPMLYFGCGVGSNLWWLWYANRLPEGRISLLDKDEKMVEYARSLITEHLHSITLRFNDAFDDEPPEYWYVYIPSGHEFRRIPETRPSVKRIEKNYDFTFHAMDGCDICGRLDELGGPFKTVFSVLVLQWVDDPARMIKAVYDSLQPGGRFILIGEDDPDAVAPTALIFPLNLRPGTDFTEIKTVCEQAGFRALGEWRADVDSHIRPYALMPRLLFVPKGELDYWLESQQKAAIGEKAQSQIILHVEELQEGWCKIFLRAQTHKMVLTIWGK